MLLWNCSSQFYKSTPKEFSTQERIEKAKGFAVQFLGKCNNKDYSEIQGFDIDVNIKKDLTPENLKKACEKKLEKTGKIIIGNFNNAITPNHPADYMDLFVFDAKYEKSDSTKYIVVGVYRDKDFISGMSFVKTPKPVMKINFGK